jgi:hypothetical protein
VVHRVARHSFLATALHQQLVEFVPMRKRLKTPKRCGKLFDMLSKSEKPRDNNFDPMLEYLRCSMIRQTVHPENVEGAPTLGWRKRWVSRERGNFGSIRPMSSDDAIRSMERSLVSS